VAEPVTIVFLTYARTQYAVSTIKSVRQHLAYPDVRWYVADDGSSEDHVAAVVDALDGANVVGLHSERKSYGWGANRGIRFARKQGDLMLFLEDDWVLTQTLDLWQDAAVLMEHEETGMVRQGYLNNGIFGEAKSYGNEMYWRLRDGDFKNFTGHPSLRHVRFHDFAGFYPEDLQPGETELGMAWQYAQRVNALPNMSPPAILYPARCAQWGLWGHIGSEQSYVWNGGVRLSEVGA